MRKCEKPYTRSASADTVYGKRKQIAPYGAERRHQPMAVAVLSSTGKKLMPTSNYHARRLLKKGRAVIAKYKPVFTIRMTDREDGET